MRIVSIAWALVRVPFTVPFQTAHGTLTNREGIVIGVTTDVGLLGLGEASPWPLFGQGTAADALRVLHDVAPHLRGLAVADVLTYLDCLGLGQPGVPAVRCGLDLAAHDLLARARGMSVSELLGGTRRPVPVNATIGAAAPAAAAAMARAARAAGFQCVKVKVAAGDLAADEARVAAVREAIGPDTQLRLDANGGWTPAAAITALNCLAHYDLELVEQPVAAGDLAGLARVRQAAPVPIAADEAARDLASVQRLIAAEAADLIVVKPMVCGGLAPARALLDLARSAGLGAFVTTTIDFGIATAGALHLAATLPTPALACGLATAHLLADDFTSGVPAVVNGMMPLPDGPGLGVTVDSPPMLKGVSQAGPTTDPQPHGRVRPAPRRSAGQGELC